MGGYGGSPPYQKRKYRCAIGRTRAGSHVSRSPSARTTYVSGSTSIRGNALLWIISRLPIERHLPTATARRARPRRRGTSWASAAFDTNVTAAVARARPKAPNIGRESTGWGVGIDAFGSPIAAHAITPPFTTSPGLTPKNAGRQSTRSASLPSSTEPTSAARPWAIAGLIVYLAT